MATTVAEVDEDSVPAIPCGPDATRCRESDDDAISSDGRHGIDPLG
jgi:hypothetical protein